MPSCCATDQGHALSQPASVFPLPFLHTLTSCAADALYNPDMGAAAGGAHATYTRFTATLDGCGSGPGVASFDADVFRLTRAEATLMDPHGRLLLEQASEAVADAAGRQQPASFGGFGGSAATGVYVGCMWSTGGWNLSTI